MELRSVRGGLLALLAIVACGRDAEPAVDSSAVVSGAPNAGVGAVAPTCPRTGHWSECTLRIRLEQSGLAPHATTEKVGDLPRLAGAPLLFRIGNAGIAAWLYPDSVARRAAAATIDTVDFIPQTKPLGMRGEGTIIQSDNVLVLLFSKNEHQRERVADAVTAGPPQK